MHHNIHQETSFPFKLNMLHFPAVLLDKWSWLVKSQWRRFRKYKSLGGAQNILQRGLYQLIIPNKSSSYKIQIQKYKIQNTNHLVVRRIFCNVASIIWSFRTNLHHSFKQILIIFSEYTNHLVVRRIFCNVVSINWSFRTNPHHSSSHLLYSNVYSYNLWSLTRIENWNSTTLGCARLGKPGLKCTVGKNDNLRANRTLQAKDNFNKCKTPRNATS